MVDLDGKVAIVTGSGAGLGRAEAVALARAGARVVLNDLPGGAEAAAEEIRGFGGEAVIVPGDVGERSTADALLTAAVDQLGGVDIVVNNAGITRDKMLFNMSDEEFDLVVRVHLRGHFLLTRNASAYWRAEAKQSGPVNGAIVNTSSEAFLSGPPGQPNYAAAKAGITALTLSTSRAMGRSGVRANAICPRAATAMTEGVLDPDGYSPDHVTPLVTYLASDAAAAITGQVFVVYGGMIAVLAPPTVAERFDSPAWDLDALDKQVGGWFADREPAATFAADSVMQLTLKEQ